MKDNKDRISYTSRGEIHCHSYKDPNSLTLGQGIVIVANHQQDTSDYMTDYFASTFSTPMTSWLMMGF